MNRILRPAKRTISILLAVMIMSSLFSACGAIRRDTPYTFRIASADTGEGQWAVRFSKNDVVSYAVQPAQDGHTDVVFTGLKMGTVDATVYHGPAGMTVTQADDVYVLTLKVDMRKNVTQSEPAYGAYSVRLSGDVAGAEWSVDCSDERIVHWKEDREYPKKSANEDGMQEFTQIYTFTGRHPGAVHVRINVTYPWAQGADNTREDLWLLVDDEYRVSRLEPTDFTSLRLTEQGMRVEKDVHEAVRMEDGVRLTHYTAISSWSDETNGYVEERLEETSAEGGEDLYLYLAGLVHACAVPDWNGFHGSNPHVLDGTTFSFEATLADGTRVSASGSNNYPNHYHSFREGMNAALRLYAQQSETETAD